MLLHARQVALKLFLLHNAELIYLHNFPVYFLSKDVITDWLACVSLQVGAGSEAGWLRSLAPGCSYCPGSSPSEARDLGGCPITLVWEDACPPHPAPPPAAEELWSVLQFPSLVYSQWTKLFAIINSSSWALQAGTATTHYGEKGAGGRGVPHVPSLQSRKQNTIWGASV